ncbi:CLUMA_CG008880, isoform A [Clunio marinus]|uniref:CLUMA_CG008880, isoform A n=1 Tax=Clunio marinus TaxID=568069 RepID=A0A1J1I4P8_9DIPT|nr:CLUMA_CG008880, isoform A [Clunio marinus]
MKSGRMLQQLNLSVSSASFSNLHFFYLHSTFDLHDVVRAYRSSCHSKNLCNPFIDLPNKQQERSLKVATRQ